jgi:hypothetical protein
MTTPSTNPSANWPEHLAREFPRGRPDSELGGHDFLDLVELDACIGGYIGQLATGRHLSTAEANRLNEMTIELEHTLRSLQGPTADYFQSLLQVANAYTSKTELSSM